MESLFNFALSLLYSPFSWLGMVLFLAVACRAAGPIRLKLSIGNRAGSRRAGTLAVHAHECGQLLGFRWMMVGMIGQIELTNAERDLAGRIVFDLNKARLEHERVVENGELAADLMRRLVDRKAIPQNRLRYFFDPEYNPKNRKASRADLFIRNAGGVEEMYRHPNFAHHLSYFVYGADLPAAVKEAFLARAQEHFVTSRELDQFACHLVRSFRLDPYPQNYGLPDAFYQLALDCGCEEWDARSVRGAVMKVK